MVDISDDQWSKEFLMFGVSPMEPVKYQTATACPALKPGGTLMIV
jgi:hypothetical protein